MSPSLSWIDPGALSAALERAGAGRGIKRPLPAPGGRAPGRDPGLLEPRPAAATRFEAPHTSMPVRLRAFIEWLRGETGASAAFVVDAEGFVLIKEGADDGIIATASYFITVIERVRAGLDSVTQGFVAVELGAGEILHVIEVQTSIGNFAAGFLLADQMRRDLVAPIKEGLRAALGAEFDGMASRGAAAR